MLRGYGCRLLALLLLGGAAGGGETDFEAARAYLLKQVEFGEGMRRVRAAEGLLDAGLTPDNIVAVFRREYAASEPDSPWRAVLSRILHRADPERRKAAREELGRIAVSPGAPGVAHAVETLGKLGARPIDAERGALCAYARKDNPLGGYARLVLAGDGDAEALAAILARFANHDDIAAFSLYYLNGLPADARAVIRVGATDAGAPAMYRVFALRAAARLGDSGPEIVSAWRALLTGAENPDVLGFLLLTGGDLGGGEAVEAVRPYLTAEDPAVRIAAASAWLRLIPPPEKNHDQTIGNLQAGDSSTGCGLKL